MVDELHHPIRLHADTAFLVFDLLGNPYDSGHAFSSLRLVPSYLITGYYKRATILRSGWGPIIQLQQLCIYTVRLISATLTKREVCSGG
jgi:hypothetical protein